MTRRAAAILVCLVVAPIWAADGPDSANIRGESTTTRKRLVQAEQQIQAGKAAEAIDELQRILDESGDDLVTADGKQFRSARQYVHQFLAKLPDAELKKYRDRVDEPATKLLAEGKKYHDAKPLLELLDRYAISRPAEDAILLLAEIAFERGEFATAEHYWKRLLQDAEVRYPGAKTGTALLQARIILATTMRGQRAEAGKLLEGFAKAHPNATGRLAGTNGKLLDTLTEILNKPTHGIGNQPGESRWTTLGGSESRDGQVTGPIQKHWPSRPRWKTPIPLAAVAATGKVGRPPSVGAVKSLAFHPVVMGSRAFVADAGRIIAFDLYDGKPQVVFDGKAIKRPMLGDAEWRIPSSVDADYSLTAAAGKLYFRFGTPELFPLPDDGELPSATPSALVCLATPPGSPANALPTQLAWTRFPPVIAGLPASWEGAPLVLDGKLLAAFVRSDAGRIIHAVACYREDSDQPQWVTDVCEEASAIGRTRHELLTFAGRNVVYCSHSGVIVAVNADKGKHAWAYRYPRIRRYPADGKHRDLAPPVAADGRVFVAPNDAEQLFAFEADTGKLLWQDGPLLFDHLIGCADGKVIATVAGPQRGLRAYDAASGSCDAPLGWRNHDDPFLPSFGRGILTAEHILWPTSAALYSIRLADGTVATQPLRGPHGNLAFANNVLLVATPTEVWGYVQDHGDEDLPTTPLPKVIGAAPLSPPKSLVEKVALSPTISQPAKLNRVTSSSPGGMNLSELTHDENDHHQLLRVVNGVPELTYSQGGFHKLDFGTPRHASYHEGRWLIADERTAAIVNGTSGKVEYRFTLPASLPDITKVVPFEQFVILDLGLHQLVAADIVNQHLYWALDAHKRNRLHSHAIESAPRILHVVRWQNQLLVQLSSGVGWLVYPRTGQVLREFTVPERAWFSEPALVANHRIAVVESACRVHLHDAVFRRVWTFDAGREASLTGEPADVRFSNDMLFAFVRRNHGLEIDRLNIANGERLWPSRPGLLSGEHFQHVEIAADEERGFFAQSQRLTALKLDTGREVWAIDLPMAANWRVLCVRNSLLVLPREAVPVEASNPLASFARYPHPRRMIGLLRTAADSFFTCCVPILLVDPRTGRLQQQLELTAAGPVSVEITSQGVWVAAGGAIYRLQ